VAKNVEQIDKPTRARRRPELALAALLVLTLPFLAGPAAGGGPERRTSAVEPYRLVASTAPDRSNPTPLNGRTVIEAVHVFVTPTTGIKRIRYLVDNKPTGNRRGFTTMPLTHGTHGVVAVLRLASGKEVTLRARFRVEHLFVSATGSPGSRCTQSSPCGSFQRAYELAKSGQVVEVAAGTYPEQELEGTRSEPKVVFRPSPDATVNVDFFNVYADHVEVRDFKGGGFNTYAEVDGFTARNLDISIFGIYGSSNVSIIGGDIGPSYRNGPNGQSTYVSYITYGANGTQAPRNILIDGAYIHDYRRSSPDEHLECLHIPGGDGITIRNSRFRRCDVFNIFFTKWAGPDPPKNVLIENNFFDKPTLDGGYGVCCTYYAVHFSDAMERFENITLRYNSAANAEFSVGQGPKTNVRFIANVGVRGSCPNDIVFSYNVWDGRRCGRTDRRERNPFVDPASSNLHLRPGSAAINAGDPKVFPRRDIDGQRRPLGKRPDAGADEMR
jgi:hypothetical protein